MILDAQIAGVHTKLTHKSKKSGGANPSGDHGGVYTDSKDRLALDKSGPPLKGMAKFLAASIFSATAPIIKQR